MFRALAMQQVSWSVVRESTASPTIHLQFACESRSIAGAIDSEQAAWVCARGLDGSRWVKFTAYLPPIARRTATSIDMPWHGVAAPGTPATSHDAVRQGCPCLTVKRFM